MRALRSVLFVLVLVLVLVLDAPLAVADEAVVIHLTDGRKLEGVLISEDARQVVLRMKLGADVPIPRAEIREIVRTAGGGPDLDGEDGDDLAGPVIEERSVLTLRDGAVIRGRATDRGDHYEVESDLGTVRIPKKLVRDVRTEKVVRGAAADAPSGDRDEARDLGLGFSVVRPEGAWRFADPPPDPLARVVMRRGGGGPDDPVVVFRVALAEPFPPEMRAVDAALQKEIGAAILREVKDRVKAVRAFEIQVGRYGGVPAWRVSYHADGRVFASKQSFREVHLSHGDGRLVLQAYTPLDQERRAGPEMERALESFSWIGPASDTGAEWLHYGLGIRLARPRSDWRIAARLFDHGRPVEVLPPDGRGSYALEVDAAGAHSTPQAAADALERRLGMKSRAFRRTARVDRVLSGVPVVDLRYRDEGPSGPEDVRRLIFVRERRLIQFVAATPAAAGAADAAERAALADALVDGIDALAEESAAALYRQGVRAVDLRVAGERKLDEEKSAQAAIPLLSQAIELAPAYGRAYLVRGKAYADMGDWRRAMKDYDAADDLLDDPAIGKLIAAAQVEQAKRVAREDFQEAKKLLVAAIRNDPQARGYRDEFARAVLEQAKTLTQAGRYDAAIDEFQDAERRFPEEPRFRREQVRLLLDWSRKLEREGELYKARSIVRRGLRIEPENGGLATQLERIEAAIKKREEGDPKKKKGGRK